MSDFTYDNEDFTAIRVATVNLQRAEHKAIAGSIFGSGLILGSQYITRNNPTSIWNKPRLLGLSLTLTLSLTYAIFTWRARERLDNASYLINKKYSNLISRTLNYEQ